MRTFILAAAAASLAMPVAPAVAQHRGYHDNGRHRGHHDNGRHRGQYRHAPPRAQWGHYDWNRRPPGYSHYYADRYYVGSGYRPVRVTRHTRIYRGGNGRYYCRRSDGTTGLIVGAALGGLLGNSLGYGDSQLAATLVGAGAGGLLGREIDRGSLSCR
jgi:hypothetical protein